LIIQKRKQAIKYTSVYIEYAKVYGYVCRNGVVIKYVDKC